MRQDETAAETTGSKPLGVAATVFHDVNMIHGIRRPLRRWVVNRQSLVCFMSHCAIATLRIASEIDLCTHADQHRCLRPAAERCHHLKVGSQCVLEVARRSQCEQPHLLRKDILGGIAVGLLILVATLPILVPFLLFSNATIAVRISNLITLVMLFGIGWWWARVVGANPLRIGAGVMGFGLALVLITIALGG